MRRFAVLGAIVALLFVVAGACASTGTNEVSTTAAATDSSVTTTAPATSSTTLDVTTTDAPVTVPEPDYAWEFNGDGAPAQGDRIVVFSGAYAVTGEAVSFDGYTGNGTTDASFPIDTSKSFSVSAWVSFAKAGDIRMAVTQLGEVTGLFGLGVIDDGNWGFLMKTEDRTGLDYAVVASGPRAEPNNSWVHLVGVSDQDAGVLHLYVNGRHVGEAPFSEPLKANGPLAIGRGQFDARPGNFWPGAIASVAMYQTALTADQVSVIRETTRPSSVAPPQPAPDPSTYANGILNGTWDYTFNDEDAAVILDDFSGLVDSADEVTVRVAFDEHQWWTGFLFDGELFLLHGVPEGAGGTFTIEDDVLVTDEGFATSELMWVLDGDTLTLTWLSGCDLEGSEPVCSDERIEGDLGLLIVEHAFTKSGDDPSY